MHKAEFLQALQAQIADMPSGEVEKTLAFYAESIDDRVEDGLSEVEAVAQLGSLDGIVKEIRADQPLTALIGQRVRSSREKSGHKTLWMVLAICGSPLWLPVALGLAVVALAIYLSIWAVVIALYAVVFAFALAAVGGLFGAVLRTVVASDPLQGVMLVGLSVCLAGLFIMTVRPMFALCKKMIRLTGAFFRWIKSLFVTKEAAV